jgi:hypothetical protein
MGLGLSRRVRAVVSVTSTWAVTFAGFGAVVGTLIGVIAVAVGAVPRDVLAHIGIGEWIAGVARWGFLGAASGTAFAVAVMRLGRGKTISELSERRFAMWGAAAGAIGSVAIGLATLTAVKLARLPLPLDASLIFGAVAGIGVLGGVLGGALATATLRAARKAPASVPETIGEVESVRV